MSVRNLLSRKRWQALFLALGLTMSQVIAPAGQVFALEGVAEENTDLITSEADQTTKQDETIQEQTEELEATSRSTSLHDNEINVQSTPTITPLASDSNKGALQPV